MENEILIRNVRRFDKIWLIKMSIWGQGLSSRKKWPFLYFNLFSIASGVGSLKEKNCKIFYTSKKLKNCENFSFKTLKTPQDFSILAIHITISRACAQSCKKGKTFLRAK